MPESKFSNKSDVIEARILLKGDESIVFDVSLLMLEKYILPRNLRGSCYYTTFQMCVILKEQYNIETNPIVGYANEGDDFFFSHAWLEFNGKKIDLAISRPNRIDVTPGPIIILDQLFNVSRCKPHTYSREKPIHAQEYERQMRQYVPDAGPQLDESARQHAIVFEASKSIASMIKFLGRLGENFRHENVWNLIK